jgi:preprotein translocase subunit SecA
VVLEFANPDLQPEEWDLESMINTMRTIYPTARTPQSFDVDMLTPEELTEAFNDEALEVYDRRADEIGEEEFRDIERRVILSILDSKWREHLYEMDYLQEGIGLRAIGQRDPLVEYQNEGFTMFQGMQDEIKNEFVQYMFHVQVVREQQAEQQAAQQQSRLRFMKEAAEGDDTPAVMETAHSDKVPRNAPCPCGSGKKYKKCHGLNA